MTERKGERIGWIGGWFGSFLWIPILSLVWLARGRVLAGLLGLSLFVLAAIVILLYVPWRYPQTRYWKLMLPLFIIMAGAVAVFIVSAGGLKGAGLDWFFLLWFLPLLMPVVTLGRRCWKEDESGPGSPSGHGP